jgi:hypothetical protein
MALYNKGKKCKVCGNYIIYSDNLIENQINSEFYLDDICIYCCNRYITDSFDIYLNLTCFDLIYGKILLNFSDENDRQLILDDINYGYNRDLLCFFGRKFMKYFKGVFVFKNEVPFNNIRARWTDIEFYNQYPLYNDYLASSYKDIRIIFEHNELIFPYVIKNFMFLDDVRYRRNILGNNATDAYIPINDHHFNDIIANKIFHCRDKDSQYGKMHETINSYELRKIIKIYDFRCDECGIRVTLSYHKKCKRGFSPIRINKSKGFNYINCRLMCLHCADAIDDKVARKFIVYPNCDECEH